MNLAPLSEEGVRQIEETAKDPRLQGAELILTSPYTRAVQTGGNSLPDGWICRLP